MARLLTGAQVVRIRSMRSDGYTVRQTAAAVGCSPVTVSRIAPIGLVGKVSNVRLREAFLASDMTAAEVGRRLDWWSRPGCADSSRVRRVLGLRDDINGQGRHSRRRLIDYETATLIAEALGMAAWELDEPESEAA